MYLCTISTYLARKLTWKYDTRLGVHGKKKHDSSLVRDDVVMVIIIISRRMKYLFVR